MIKKFTFCSSIALFLILFSCIKPTDQNLSETIINIEKNALDRWGKGDPSGYLEIYDDDITYFDPATKQRIDGLIALKDLYEPFKGKIKIEKYDMIDPQVQIHGNTAVLTFNLIDYVSSDDSLKKTAWNSTEVYSKIDGQWKILHSHWSYTGQESTAYKIISDIAYKDGGSDYERERCKLDLYLPQEVTDFPVLIWFHGGGLKGGDKTHPSVIPIGKRFASEGIGVAMVNYRLNPGVKFPAYIEDAASAVAWVYRHIQDYKGNPNQIYVGGHSAGAYLTAMIGLDKHYLEALRLSPDYIAGLIPISGQMYSHSTVREERGLPDTAKIIDNSAPLFHVRKNAPPLMSVCADSDVVLTDNQFFLESLKKTGHAHCEFIEVKNRNHVSIVTNIKKPDDVVAKLMLKFIRSRD